MRTTVTLDPDVAARLQQLMRERGISFKEALNDAVRSGLGDGRDHEASATPTFSMGAPTVPLDGALRLAADLEDEESVRRLAAGR